MAQEVPELVKQARRAQGWTVGAMLGGQFTALAIMMFAINVTKDTPWFPFSIVGGILLMALAVGGALYNRRIQLQESAQVIKAWEHLTSQAKATELEAELATPATLHPLVDQIRQRQASLGPEARAVGKRLLQLERERQSVEQTLDALPDGPTKDELRANLGTVETEHADLLDALARLYTAAMSGQHADPALVGLVSEVPLAPAAEALSEARRTGSAKREAESASPPK